MSRPNGRNEILSSARVISRPMSRDVSGALSSSPIRTRYSGVTDSAIVSPIASWKPSFALSRKSTGRSLQVRRNRTVRWHDLAVLLAQLQPRVRVELHVQRPHLIPEPIELAGERVGRHVVLRAPHRPRVGEPELFRSLVRELDEPLVVLSH